MHPMALTMITPNQEMNFPSEDGVNHTIQICAAFEDVHTSINPENPDRLVIHSPQMEGILKRLHMNEWLQNQPENSDSMRSSCPSSPCTDITTSDMAPNVQMTFDLTDVDKDAKHCAQQHSEEKNDVIAPYTPVDEIPIKVVTGKNQGYKILLGDDIVDITNSTKPTDFSPLQTHAQRVTKSTKILEEKDACASPIPKDVFDVFKQGEEVKNSEHNYTVPVHRIPQATMSKNEDSVLMPPPISTNVPLNHRVSIKLPGCGTITYTKEGFDCIMNNRRTIPRVNSVGWRMLQTTRF